MSGIVSKKKLMFLLLDSQNRSYYWNGTNAVTSAQPVWLQQNPDNWKNISLKFATNQKYFSTLRTFSDPIELVDDGANIILDRFHNGAGTEEIMYLAMLISRPDLGLNYYKLEYKSRIDFSKIKQNPRTGVSINLLQDDVFALIQANENAVYSIDCNASNPSAIQVLFDGVSLQDKANYEIISFTNQFGNGSDYTVLPISYLSNDGDNVNAILSSQELQVLSTLAGSTNYLLNYSNSDIIVTIKGQIKFKCNSGGAYHIYPTYLSSGMPSSGRLPFIFMSNPITGLIAGQVEDFPINISFNLPRGEGLFIMADGGYPNGANVTHYASSLYISFQTKQIPTISYALRPLDYLQQLVSKITDNQFTVNSKFFSANNKKVILSGSSIRGYSDAKIQCSFSDFFTSYNVPYNLSLTVRDGVLWIEPKEDLYNNNQELLELGEVSAIDIEVATEYIYNSVQIGYVKQIYNQRNGRYETNCLHNYKTPINNVINNLSLISKYRTDSFGIEFIRSLNGQDTKDDKGDKEIFAVMITDAIGTTTGETPTAIVFNVDTFFVDAPIITVPTIGATVYNTNPTIFGTAQPFHTINVYVDGFVDGTTVADANGYWSYNIVKVLQTKTLFLNGQHTVEASQTDVTGNTGPLSAQVVFVVDISQSNILIITAPSNNSSLYNNLPLLKGYGISGDTVTLKDNGTTITTVIPDNSGYWQYQIITPLSNAVHTITAISTLNGAIATINITVNTAVSSPLITSIVQNQTIYSNTPTIKGVAVPGATVNIYVDGGIITPPSVVPTPDATVTADSNGDWSWTYNLQYNLDNRTVIPNPGVVIPLPDGGHVFSTTPDNAEVQLQISGYKLMRGTTGDGSVCDFDTIILDDSFVPTGVDPSTLPDSLGRFLHTETLFNILDTSPLRCLRKWDNFINGGLYRQNGQLITFNGAEMNSNLSTSKNGVVLNENANVNVNDMAAPFFYPLWLNFTTKVPDTFNDIMTGINNVGYLSLEFKGIQLYALPIGTMQMRPATDEAQQWKLLCSAKTTLSNLLILNNSGQTFQIGKNMIYISDLNPLHFVQYDFTPPAQYNSANLYQDWFKNRFLNWVGNPDYLQKWQNTDKINLQVITNETSTLTLQMYNCVTQKLINTYTFSAVSSPVQTPMILQQLSIDLSGVADGQYVFVLYSGITPIAIAEKINLAASWPTTYLIEYGKSKNKVDYFFSTGIKPMIRVEAFWMPYEPYSEVNNYEDEMGDFEILRGVPLKKRTLTLGGSPDYIPDWMVIKLNQILLLDQCFIENEQVARTNDSKLEKSEDVPGYPMNYYKIELVLANNETGNTFLTPADNNKRTTLFTLDATAFGQSDGTVDVQITNN